VRAGHTEVVVLTVNFHMLLVACGELLHGSLHNLHAAFLTHSSSGNVGVKTSTVPVTGNWLWCEGDLCAEFFSNTVEEEAGHPELVTEIDTWSRTDLVFPLGGHDFSVGTRDLNASVQAGLVVSLDDVTGDDLAGADTTVVWALRSWEAVLGPAIWPAISAEESVLLLETEPITLILVLLHDNSGVVTEVVGVWLSIGHPSLGHDKDVVAQSNGIWVECDGAEVDIGVVTWSLAGGGAIEIPFWELFDLFDLFWESLQTQNVSYDARIMELSNERGRGKVRLKARRLRILSGGFDVIAGIRR
jgi:hypothetical protein